MTATAVPTLGEIKSWPATTNVPMACAALGISVSHGYALIKTGDFPCQTVNLGTRRRVITADLIRLLEGRDT